MTDTIIAHFVAYEDGADLDVEYDGGDPTVENHDELVNEGKTYDEIRALADTETNRQILSDRVIVEPGDPMWDDEFADWDVGDSKKVIA